MKNQTGYQPVGQPLQITMVEWSGPTTNAHTAVIQDQTGTAVVSLFASANAEELRKRFQSQGWSPMTPNPVATPPRA